MVPVLSGWLVMAKGFLYVSLSSFLLSPWAELVIVSGTLTLPCSCSQLSSPVRLTCVLCIEFPGPVDGPFPVIHVCCCVNGDQDESG